MLAVTSLRKKRNNVKVVKVADHSRTDDEYDDFYANAVDGVSGPSHEMPCHSEEASAITDPTYRGGKFCDNIMYQRLRKRVRPICSILLNTSSVKLHPSYHMIRLLQTTDRNSQMNESQCNDDYTNEWNDHEIKSYFKRQKPSNE